MPEQETEQREREKERDKEDHKDHERHEPPGRIIHPRPSHGRR